MSAQTTLIQLRINGEEREVPSGLTVRELLVELDLQPEMIVVELNREILSRDQYAQTPAVSGDVLELVHFVGGG